MRFKKFMLVCAGVLSALAFISEVKSEEPVVVEGKILVRYESSLSAQEVETIEKEFGLQRLNYMSAINTGYYRISGSEDQIDLIERLRKKTGVVLVEEDLLRTQSAAIPNDPLYGQQWYLNSATAAHINFQSAIQAFSGTTTIDVAVIDSGILYNHPDFVGKINTTWAYDYVENDTTAQDENGHGTMVASLIGAAHNNGSGLAGVCPNVRFLPLRVFDNAGRFATTTSGVLVSALQRAYDANVRVVNLSLGGGGYSASELSMFEALNSRGIVAVIAAGNGDSYGRGINNDSSPTYPASYSAPNIISVMATDSSGNATAFSNYGSSSVDIAAPGAGVLAANVRRATAYNDDFSLGANEWLNGTVSGSSPWTQDYRSFRGNFAPYNMAGIYKYFDFTGKQGLRAELTGYLILGYGDILLFEVWDGTQWNYIDVIAWPGDIALSKSLDVSAFDGQVGYARIMLYCDVWSYGASFTRFCEIDTIKITEVSPSSTSDPEYLSVDGTSFSAPLVAGTAALLLSKNPTLTGAEVKQAILSTASTRSSLSGKSVTGGIVNVAAALDAADARPSQTISFGSIASKTYGDPSFAISASSSSGLAVSFSSSNTGVATIAGNTITIIGAGSTTITASQAGNASFSAAANVQQILTVSPKGVTVVAAAKTKTYGSTDPALTFTAGGLLGSDSLTGALSRTAGENAGSYSILQGTLTAGSNYLINYTGALFTINPAELAIPVINITEPLSLVYNGLAKEFVAKEPNTEIIELSKIGNPSSGYGVVVNLLASGYRTTSYNGVDGVFRPYQSETKITSTGLTYAFAPNLVSTSSSGEGSRPPWQNTTAATGGPTAQLDSHFSALGITWSQNSLFAVPSSGITYDLLEIKPAGITKFTTYFAMHSGVSVGDAAYAILLDGVVVASGRNFTSSSPFSNFIEVNIPPNCRFLTLVAGDNGDNYDWDHCVFVDPKLIATGDGTSVPITYSGIDGTSYGPTSTAPINAGHYKLKASSTDPNYSGSKEVNFSITPAPVTVIAAAKTKTFGSADPALTYTASGLMGSDALSGALTRAAGENAGSYSILQGTLMAGSNYSINYTEASLQITSATLSQDAITITAPFSLVYDGAGKSYTASASGVSGFSYAYSGVLPTTYGPSSAAPTNVGTYKITASSTDPNYSGSKEVNFSITPAPVTVIAAAKTKTFGSADPALTYTASGLMGSDALSGALTRAAGENAGSYSILQGTLMAGSNYSINYTEASLQITSATLSQDAITITAPFSLVYDGAGKSYTASASGVSGFSYAYSGVLPTTYGPSSAAPTNVGTYKITASSTDPNYSGSKEVNFSITPASVTVIAAAKTKTFGSADPALTYTASGLMGSDTLSGALIRAEGENAGSYSILQGTLTVGSNYSLSYTEASLQITPAPVTVVAAAKTKTFGSADPTLTYTASGLIGSDVLSGALTRAEGENAGSYNISQGTLSAGSNYLITYTGASLQITSATLSENSITTTALSSLVYDGADKSHTASASGVSGFSYTYSGVLPTTYASSSTAPSNVGTYKVTASSTDPNYSGSKEVSFSIIPAPVTVVAAAKTKTFGSADPALTYAASGLVGSDAFSGALTRAAGENAGSYNILQGTLAVGSNYLISYTGALLTINPAELASSAINITEPSNLVYNGLAKDFSGEINIPGSAQTEIIQLSKIGNPSSGYGVVHNLSAGGYRTTSYSGIDGVFRPYQSETKITSTGLTYSFAANLVGTSTAGETARPPWQNTTAATGGPTGQLDSYFSPLGINWSQNSLFAAPSSGITYDLSKLKPANKNLSKFTTYYGMHSGAAPGDAAFAVLLDGVLVASGRDYKASNPFSGLIEINIGPNNRFLTLVACDNGDDYDWDHSVFVDPKLAAVDSTVNAAVTYSGVAGTLYGPTSIPPRNAGNYKVTASSSDPNYFGSKEVNFVISPVSVAVVADDKTKKYGLADPEFTFSATGLLGSDTLSGALTRATGESPGTYAISLGTLSGTPNYSLSYTGASLVIQPNYQSWAAAHNLSGNDASNDSDPDQDGLSNAHEFAMGGNPTIASKGTLVITSASGGMKCLWIQRKDKTLVSYSPKTSADLGAPFTDWTPVQSVLSNPQPEGIHSDYEQVEVVLPTSAGKGFLKVQATVR